MEKHLIAFDLDDTVVRKLVYLSDYTADTLCELQKMGHFIMPATARPLHLVDWVVDRIRPKAPVAMLNGAYLYDFNRGADVHPPFLIGEGEVREIWEYFRCVIGSENILNVICEQRDYIATADAERDRYSSYTEHIKSLTRHDYVSLSGEAPGAPFARMTIFPKVEYADEVCSYLNSRYPSYRCERVDWNDVAADMKTRLYFSHAECNKWYAIKRAADYLGIGQENIITFGDQWNDRLMLTANPNGYALRGSYAERFASKVTEHSCAEDGVARELHKIFNF